MLKPIIVLLFLFSLVDMHSQNTLYIGDSGSNSLFSTDYAGNILKEIDNDINTPRECVEDTNAGMLFCVNGSPQNSIIAYNLVDNSKNIISTSSIPISIDIDPEEKQIYFSDFGENRIYRMDYNGDNKIVVTSDIESPSQIFIDTKNSKLISNDELNSVVTFDLDGSNKQVVADNLNNCEKLTVDPINEFIYFVENNDESSIYKIKYSGIGKELIMTTDFKLRGFEIDCMLQKLLFTFNERMLMSIDFDGSNSNLMTIDNIDNIGFVNISQESDCQLSSSLELNQANSMTLYPNPFRANLNIEINNSLIEKIEIYNFNGELIKHYENLSQTHLNIELESLNNQAFLVRAFYKNGESINKVVLKF